ncbi:thymidine kinase, cytosolic [Pelobates cultripes]|uniref:Thymidine kinase n=2 Tax=Pelobates cultripes TaxID=61616 RepID=A0AAD1S4U8_PELCU|nr:thymidine kinase, cytosolic [Pelobates cultripes]
MGITGYETRPNHDLETHSSSSERVIFGPMFSGKSTELMRRVRRFQIAQYKCMVIKYAKDTRYSKEHLSTHDKNTMAAVSACILQEVSKEALTCSVIGIDEGQFFPDIVDFCEEMANQGKTVIVAALDGTFQRKAFGDILNLVPLAESVVKLNAVCMECYREAAYTQRLGTEKEVEVIGGADKYHSVCRQCYFQKQSPSGGKENNQLLNVMDTTPYNNILKRKSQRTPLTTLPHSQNMVS